MSATSASYWAALSPEWARLSAYQTALSAAVTLTPGLTAAQVQSSRTVLSSVAHWVARLGPTGDLGVGVQAGTFSAERWVRIANEQARALEVAWEAISPFGAVLRVWEEIVVPSVEDGYQLGKDTAQAVGAGLPWVALGLAALAVVYFARALR